MTSKQQFEELWKAGCKHGVLSIINNKGQPLSRSGLQREIKYALRKGFVKHVIVLSELAQTKLKTHQVEALVNRCRDLQWIPDALCAARYGILSSKTRTRLIGAAIAKGLVGNQREGAELLSLD